MSTLKDLKYVVFHEWTYDPPGGGITFYYGEWFHEPASVKSTIEEILSHVKDANCFDDDDDDDENDELEGLDPMDEDGNLTIDAIKGWSWDNGGSGCGTVIYAEGADIVDSVVGFLEDEFDDVIEFEEWDDFDDDEEEDTEPDENLAIINRAKENPENLDAVMDLLRMMDRLIEEKNDSVW